MAIAMLKLFVRWNALGSDLTDGDGRSEISATKIKRFEQKYNNKTTKV